MLYRIWTLISSTFLIWDKANSSRMSAAMTYYTMLSLAPLLMIAIAIAGYVYDSKQAQAEVIQNVKVATSPAIAKTVAGMIENATHPSTGILASTISLLVLFYGASGVFSQLFDTFNDIWEVPPETRTGILFSLQKRLIGVGMVLVAGLLLIGTLMLGSVITYVNGLVDFYPHISSWLSLADRSMSFLLMPFVFALIFWFFPATKVQWRDVWPAGVLTACLIASSRYLIDFYLRFSSTSEVYGAAGSLVVLLIWVYMTGLVVFFGASFCFAWAKTFGSLSETSDLDSAGQPSEGPVSAAPLPQVVISENATFRENTVESWAESSGSESVPPLVLHRRSGKDST